VVIKLKESLVSGYGCIVNTYVVAVLYVLCSQAPPTTHPTLAQPDATEDPSELALLSSCSFYDHSLHLWTAKLPSRLLWQCCVHRPHIWNCTYFLCASFH